VKRSAVQEEDTLQKKMRKHLWLDIQSRSAGKMVHTPTTPSKVIQYRWKAVHVGFTGFNGVNHNEKGSHWFFTEDHASEDYLIHGDHDNGSPLLAFDTREVEVPRMEDILTLIFIHLLMKEVGDLATANCGGCVDEQANQMGHMDPGCLDDWEQQVDLYLHLARQRVSRNSIVSLSRKVMAILKPNEEYVIELVMPLIKKNFDMSLQELKSKIEMNYPLDRAYKAFFSEDDNKET
jgi:hypothetical protein